MKSRLCCLLLISMLMAPLAANAATSTYRGHCTITFQVQKTVMKDFTGTATCEPFEIIVTDDLISIPVIVVPVASMDTGNSRRDREMRAMFESQTFPRITGEAEAFTADRLSTPERRLDQMPEELTFALTIRDITQTITARVTEPHIDASAIEATLVFDLSLASFELDPPSFIGIVRVRDDLLLRAKVSLDRSPTSAHIPTTQE
ncbi:YceI family protein [Pelovirga terrestris]|uniref:YceI family protein n=1 Tax=Pelovirga terrestris TaxID=2771352 RepID=A0A8J6QZM0_9BACT|nr:YceI family protein [Pelovirga terrestris]MBD1401457.1 YceI family protein [Pelovirga terrestris]